MFKFIHAADIHLDSPCLGLEQYEGAPVQALRAATRAAISNLIDLAVTEEVEFVLIAGDLYDGDWRDYNTGLFMTAQMARLQKAGIRVFIVAGNHDAASRITRHLSFPDNVYVFPVKKPKSIVLPELRAVIHGQGFESRTETEDLAAGFPAPQFGSFNIGLLHTSLDGRAGHATYAPTTLEVLVSKGYDYWALGHVHKREVISEMPWIVFPGNLQGRHARETGPKGATLVRVENNMVVDATHHDLDDVRWEECGIDASAAAGGEEVMDSVRNVLEAAAGNAENRVLAVRIRLTGTSQAHAELSRDWEKWLNQIRACGLEAGDKIWIEKVLLQTSSPMDLNAVADLDNPVGGLVRTLRGLKGDEASLRELMDTLFQDLKRALPAEYFSQEEVIDPRNPAVAGSLVREVEQLLIPRLLNAEERS